MEPKPMNRKQSYSRMVIRQALLDLLEQMPLKKVTVTDICKRADVNRTTFYTNYTDIYDLLKSITQDLHDEVRQVLTQYDHVDGLAYYTALLTVLQEHASACRALMQLTAQDCKIMEMDFLFSDLMTTRRWNVSESFPSDQPEPLLARYVLAGSQAIINDWLCSPAPLPISTMAKYLFDMNSRFVTLEAPAPRVPGRKG